MLATALITSFLMSGPISQLNSYTELYTVPAKNLGPPCKNPHFVTILTYYSQILHSFAMTKEVYRELLKKNLLPFWKRNRALFDEFQQDNDPKHASKLVQRWFRHPRVNIPVMKWPSQSPDLKHLWEILKRRVAGSRAVAKEFSKLSQIVRKKNLKPIANVSKTIAKIFLFLTL